MFFFNNINLALAEYRAESITHYKNKSYKIALKNLNFFNVFSAKILFCILYETCLKNNDNDSFLQSPGIVVFYDNYIVYSNRKNLSKMQQEKLEYDNIHEISVIQRDNIFLGSTIFLFLNNNTKISFGVNNLASYYMLKKFMLLTDEVDFPFAFIANEENRFVFFHR